MAAIAFAIPAQLAAPVLHLHGIKLAHDAAGQIDFIEMAAARSLISTSLSLYRP